MRHEDDKDGHRPSVRRWHACAAAARHFARKFSPRGQSRWLLLVIAAVLGAVWVAARLARPTLWPDEAARVIAAAAFAPSLAASRDRIATLVRVATGMAASEAELAARIAVDVAALGDRADAVAAECRAWMTPAGSARPLRFTSQFGQDSTLLTLFAGGGASNAGRVYVDVGANDPKGLSNTYFFDKCLGWRGVCIEANPALAATLRSERSCTVVNKCVSATRGTLRFATNGVNGHIASATADADASGTADVECAPLADILRDVGVDRVDYMTGACVSAACWRAWPRSGWWGGAFRCVTCGDRLTASLVAPTRSRHRGRRDPRAWRLPMGRRPRGRVAGRNKLGVARARLPHLGRRVLESLRPR